ncbi:tetratricopeptide repeat-containing sensor histidine kinase [Flavobacterium sp. UBA7682]|uniref:tetratricopeptide repeat-containing sensor histidine kinase n=1 Tax=Flavobacterium sp. UBA7682 TaxID=1946560 RepID=UPI0025C6CC97|nr:sensor histidine kinase [Flavobacterium sp. UBA7682]
MDSISLLEKSSTGDSIYMDLLFNISTEYYYLNKYDLSLKITEKALQLAKQRKDTIAIARAYFYKGDCYEYNQRDSAYYFYHQAEKLYSFKGDKEKEGQTLFKKGYLLFYEGNYLESEIQVSNALKLLQNSKNNQLLYSCYVVMGYNFEKLEEYNNALKYFHLSKTVLDELKKSNVDFEKTNNYTVNYSINIANIYDKKGEYQKSIKELSSVVSPDLKAKWPKDYASVIGNLGYSKMKFGILNGVEKAFRESLQLSKQNNHQNNIMYQLINLGEYYSITKDTASSIHYLKEANALAVKLKAVGEIKSTLKLLSEIDVRNNRLYNQKYISITDSLTKAQRINRNRYARIEYETAVVENENRDLIAENLYVVTGSIAIVLLLVLLIIYRYLQHQKKEIANKRQQQKAEEEIFELLKEYQIKLAQAKELEQNRISKELHDSVMNKLYGVRLQLGMLNEGDTQEVKQKRSGYIDFLQEIEREIRSISHDLHNETFETLFDYKNLLLDIIAQHNQISNTHFSFECEDEFRWDAIDSLVKIAIYRIIQEALRNVIKYAKAKNCRVSLSDGDNKLRLWIEDDGKGFDIALLENGGIGLKNMQERATQLNASFKVMSEIGKGTTIEVVFALK